MKEVILKYLKSQYCFTPKSYVNYKVFDIAENREVSLSVILKSLPKIFGSDETEIMAIFEAWADEQAIIMNNRVTEYKYAYFAKYGVELPASELDDYVIGPEFIPTTEEP